MKKLQLLIVTICFCNILVARHKSFIVGGAGITAMLTKDGKVLAWGLNKQGNNIGTLGVVEGGLPILSQNVDRPKEVMFPVGVEITELAEIKGGYFLALSCKGNVLAWGNNEAGQLGNGNTTNQTSPQFVKVLPGSAADLAGYRDPITGNLQRISKINAGTNTSFAITDDGFLLSWGCNNTCSQYANRYGMLGNRTSINSLYPMFVMDGLVSGRRLQNVMQVSAGEYSVIALIETEFNQDNTGTVYSWGMGIQMTLGRNSFGNGNNGKEDAPSDVAMPVRTFAGPSFDGKLSAIKSISTTNVSCYALDVNGHIWAWGSAWGGVTGQGMQIEHSDPRRVVKGEITGEGTDGKYLLAKSVSGGLGFVCATTLDNRPVSWGNNNCLSNVGPADKVTLCGGNLGNGGVNKPTAPVYIQSSSYIIHNDVIAISSTLQGGYYIRYDNSIWAWGDNSVGQVGIGGYNPQNRSILFNLPLGYTSLDPNPIVELPYDTTICASKLKNGASLIIESGLNLSPQLLSKYRFTWFRVSDPNSSISAYDTIQSNIVANGVGTPFTNFRAITSGRYWVKIQYIGSSSPCGNYPPVYDYVTISTFPVSFTPPQNLDYCGYKGSVKVNSLNNTLFPKYNWYSSPSSSQVYASSFGSQSVTIDLSNVTTASNGDKTVYVEEKSAFTGSLLPKVPCSTSNIMQSDYQDKYVRIVVYEDITLDSLSVMFCNSSNQQQPPKVWQASVFTAIVGPGNGELIPNTVNGPLYYGPLNSFPGNSTYGCRPITIPVKIYLPGSNPGIIYFVNISKGSENAEYNCASIQYPIRFNYPGIRSPEITGTYVHGSFNMGNTYNSLIYNFQISSAQKYCERVPVILKQKCICNKPSSV